MRQIVYILLAVLVLLIAKAMFLDDYLAARKAAESNDTVQSASSTPPPKATTAPLKAKENKMAEKKDENDSIREKYYPDYKQSPLEKAGDAIANEFEDKIDTK